MTDVDWFAVLTGSDEYGVAEPTPSEELDLAEASLDFKLPTGLRALYAVTNGVMSKPGAWVVIWPVGELVQRNLTAYEAEGSERRSMVAFGDDGTGNPFCVQRDGGEAIHYWNPIDAEATWLATDIVDFWSRWNTSDLPPH